MKKGILEYVSLRRYLSAGVYTGPVYTLAFYGQDILTGSESRALASFVDPRLPSCLQGSNPSTRLLSGSAPE